MKNIIEKIICVLVLTCSSCVDDLSLKPLDAISESDVFSDAKLLDAFVRGRYDAFLSIHQGTDRLGSDSMSDLVVFILSLKINFTNFQ